MPAYLVLLRRGAKKKKGKSAGLNRWGRQLSQFYIVTRSEWVRAEGETLFDDDFLYISRDIAVGLNVMTIVASHSEAALIKHKMYQILRKHSFFF